MTDTRRNDLAADADDKYAAYQQEPTAEAAAELIALIPSLAAEIDEAQRWAVISRNHRESLQRRLNVSRDAAERLLEQEKNNAGSGRDGHLNEDDLMPLFKALWPSRSRDRESAETAA